MKKVLVTGADGFIGSHLTELLVEKGYKVRALSYYNSFNYWGWLEEIPNSKNLEIVSGDIRDPHFCKTIVKDVDIIYHLAALIAIPYSYIAPDLYIETNIKGTLNICQAAKENGGLRIIQTSTSEVYGTARYVPINESHPKQPQSPYSASKIGADAIALSFFHSFDLPVIVARPFNTFGPRQSARAFIPTIISQIVSGKKEINVGDLTPMRDFTFVKDTVNGLFTLSECDTAVGKEVNICSGFEISMMDVALQIKKILNSDAVLITESDRVRPDGSEVLRLYGDNSLLKSLTGFSTEYDLIKGLEITCKWFSDSNNLSKYKANIYNL